MKLTANGFKILRTELFYGKLSQAVVDALNYLVQKCEAAGFTYPETAYALATTYHETDRTMEPIKEKGSLAYLTSKKYYPYIGYGYVQITWRDNYLRVGKLIGKDLVSKPSLALNPDIAASIMTGGMLNGWFTGLGFRKGRPVGRYDRNAYIRARKIINGSDRAVAIADYAMIFEKALRSN